MRDGQQLPIGLLGVQPDREDGGPGQNTDHLTLHADPSGVAESVDRLGAGKLQRCCIQDRFRTGDSVEGQDDHALGAGIGRAIRAGRVAFAGLGDRFADRHTKGLRGDRGRQQIARIARRIGDWRAGAEVVETSSEVGAVPDVAGARDGSTSRRRLRRRSVQRWCHPTRLCRSRRIRQRHRSGVRSSRQGLCTSSWGACVEGRTTPGFWNRAIPSNFAIPYRVTLCCVLTAGLGTAHGRADRPRPRTDLAAIFVAAAASGPAVLEIDGEPGIGKTTLFRYTVDLARLGGSTVLECSPTQAESAMSYVGLTDMLRNLPDSAFDDLPAPQRHSLEVATLRATPSEIPLDERAVGTGLATLLSHLAESGAVILAIDDLQWLDRSSADVLTFVAQAARDGGRRAS